MLLGHDSGELRQDGSVSNVILTTWQISIEHIRSRRPSAADLLSLMSFCDRQGIPEALLKPLRNPPIEWCKMVIKGRIKSFLRMKTGSQSSHLDRWKDSKSDSSDIGTDDEFETDLRMLRNYYLITIIGDGHTFEMHRLIQLSTRKWLESRSLQERFKRQYVTGMAASFLIGEYRNRATCERLLAHVEAAI